MPTSKIIAGVIGGLFAVLVAGPLGAEAQTAPAATPSVWDLLKAGEAAASGNGVAKDPDKARKIFEGLMQSDDNKAAAAAAFDLAKLAKADLHDEALATQALERCTALGDPYCMMMRAQDLAKGKAQDQQRAIALYQQVIDTNGPDVKKEAYYELGQLYLTPPLLSAKLAILNHQKAADLGNLWSLFAIGGIYDKGTGTKPDWKKAVDFYQRAFDKGGTDVKGATAYALAQLYLKPAHSDPKRAVGYLMTGQQNGNVWSTLQLADCYLKGLGVKKSTATGLRMYNDLRNGKDPAAAKAAAFQLGRYYSGPPRRDLKLAENNFAFGVAQGDVWSAYFLAQLYIRDMPSKANRRKARDLLQTVSKSDDPNARSAAAALLKTIR